MPGCKVFTISILGGCAGHGSGFRLRTLSNTHKTSKLKPVMERNGFMSTVTMASNTATPRRIASADQLRYSLLFTLASQAASQSQRCISANPIPSLLFALASQAASQSQRLAQSLASETLKYINPRRFEARSLEEALMAVPDLETVPFKILRREEDYEIRKVQSYYVAEATMPGNTGFDFYGSSQAFNVLAAYLFGKNKKREEMEMTTPVFVQKTQTDGEKMDMTTPVVTKQERDQGKWKMSFVLPSKYGEDLPLPDNSSVRIKLIQEKIVAVATFSGFVTDKEVRIRESKLRAAVSKDPQVHVKEGASVEIAQYNPPFTLPFMRRNELSLEVEWNKDYTR